MKKLYELYEEDLRELFKGHENGCAFALRLVGDDCENYGRCYQCPMYDRGSNADLVIDEALEAIEVIALAERTTPKKLIYEGDGDGELVYDTAFCPNCNNIFEYDSWNWKDPYCPKCGQALDWEEKEQ